VANKNKTKNGLVKTGDGRTISGFEIIPTLTQAVGYPSSVSEVDENTHDVEAQQEDAENLSKTELLKRYRQHTDRIDELEFEVEQRDVRVRGLEKELAVREEITASINTEIHEARKQIVNAAKELDTLNEEYISLQAIFSKAEAKSRSKDEATEQIKQVAIERSRRISDLELQLKTAKSELCDLKSYIYARRESWSQFETENARMQGRIDRLEEENRNLQNAPRPEIEPELKRCRELISRQSGELSAGNLELDRLRKDNARFEDYSNELRIRLQDQTAATKESTAMRQKLESSLDVAGGMINELTLKVEEEKARVNELNDERQIMRAEFERDIRQLRFELTTAHETIADRESVNEQLASDLVDNKEFRQALEAHVADVEYKNTKTIQQLRRKLQKLDDDADEYERKLRVKDGAVADLMKELADQSSRLNFSHDLENALRKIDGNRPDQRNSGQPGARDRITRQLIGSADGKELRFPLFRNRLTIGRTAHNDIQLAMRFVSRRHAVIATDSEQTRVIDWGSRNGVYVNKRRVTEKILASGDVITIGLTNLRYEERPKR
jgi:chromosome segregation ATPase